MNIGIAFSGGGAKGAAHIGVLKVLEKNNIKLSAFTGASIGSIIATLYAMGYTADEMLKLFQYFSKSILKADFRYLFSNLKNTKGILGQGIISGEDIEEIINECANLKGYKYIKDIPNPISITSVDIITKKECIFTNKAPNELKYTAKSEKDLLANNNDILKNKEYTKKEYITDIEIGKAVRASCSYPGIFAPLEYKNYKFADGGILNNIPTNELQLLGADKILAVRFPAEKHENPERAIDVLFRCVDLAFEARDEEKIQNSNYILDIILPSSAVFDIKKINFCYEEGYKLASQNIEEITFTFYGKKT